MPIGDLNRVLAGFSGSDPQRLFHRRDKDFTVTDLACVGSLSDFFHDLLDPFGLHDDLDLYFRNEIDNILCAAVNFLVSFLAPVAFHFGNGHALYADFIQRFFDIIQLERLDDCIYFLHLLSSCPNIRTLTVVRSEFKRLNFLNLKTSFAVDCAVETFDFILLIHAQSAGNKTRDKNDDKGSNGCKSGRPENRCNLNH